MKKDKLSLLGLIEEAKSYEGSFDHFLVEYNAEILETSTDKLLEQMQHMLDVMRGSIEYGLTGVKSRSKLTGGDAKKLLEASGQEKFVGILGEKVLDAVIYATAVGECNAAMGRIVAAPTAGASGVLPGVFFSLAKHYNLSDEDLKDCCAPNNWSSPKFRFLDL